MQEIKRLNDLPKESRVGASSKESVLTSRTIVLWSGGHAAASSISIRASRRRLVERSLMDFGGRGRLLCGTHC